MLVQDGCGRLSHVDLFQDLSVVPFGSMARTKAPVPRTRVAIDRRTGTDYASAMAATSIGCRVCTRERKDDETYRGMEQVLVRPAIFRTAAP